MILNTIETVLTVPNVLFALTFIGVIFSVYLHFKKPQEDTEIKQIITDKDLGTKATVLAQKEAEGKAQLLQQQVVTEKEYNTKKFVEFSDRADKTDKRIETLIETVNCMNLSLSKELMRVGTLVGQHMILNDNLFNNNVAK